MKNKQFLIFKKFFTSSIAIQLSFTLLVNNAYADNMTPEQSQEIDRGCNEIVYKELDDEKAANMDKLVAEMRRLSLDHKELMHRNFSRYYKEQQGIKLKTSKLVSVIEQNMQSGIQSRLGLNPNFNTNSGLFKNEIDFSGNTSFAKKNFDFKNNSPSFESAASLNFDVIGLSTYPSYLDMAQQYVEDETNGDFSRVDKGSGPKLNFYKNYQDQIEKAHKDSDSDLLTKLKGTCISMVKNDRLAQSESETSIGFLDLVRDASKLTKNAYQTMIAQGASQYNPYCARNGESKSYYNKEGRRNKCEEKEIEKLSENSDVHSMFKLVSMIYFDPENILPDFATEDYCQTCISQKFDIHKKISLNQGTKNDEDLKKYNFKEAKSNAMTDLVKGLQKKSLAKSLLKASSLVEQMQHTKTWLPEEGVEGLEDYMKKNPCLTNKIISKRLKEDAACKNNDNKLNTKELLGVFNNLLELKNGQNRVKRATTRASKSGAGSFDDLITKISDLSDKSKQTEQSENNECSRISRDKYVKRTVANNLTNKMYDGANYLLDEMVNSFRNKSGFLDNYEKNNNNQSPLEYLALQLSTDIQSETSISPLRDFFLPENNSADPNEILKNRIENHPALENMARDKQLMSHLDKKRKEETKKAHAMNVEEAIRAYLGRLAKTTPHLYYLMNDKDQFIQKMRSCQSDKSKFNGKFSRSIDPTFLKNDPKKYSDKMINDFKGFKNNICKKLVDEMVAVACPNHDQENPNAPGGFLSKFSNEQKRDVAKSIIKEKNNKTNIKEVGPEKLKLEGIALESAACIATLPIEGTDSFEKSPLNNIDLEINPIAQSDFAIDLKEKFGLPTSKHSKNLLNEFEKSKLCNNEELDKRFDCSITKSRQNCDYDEKDIAKLADAKRKEANRVAELNNTIGEETKVTLGGPTPYDILEEKYHDFNINSSILDRSITQSNLREESESTTSRSSGSPIFKWNMNYGQDDNLGHQFLSDNNSSSSTNTFNSTATLHSPWRQDTIFSKYKIGGSDREFNAQFDKEFDKEVDKKAPDFVLSNKNPVDSFQTDKMSAVEDRYIDTNLDKSVLSDVALVKNNNTSFDLDSKLLEKPIQSQNDNSNNDTVFGRFANNINTDADINQNQAYAPTVYNNPMYQQMTEDLPIESPQNPEYKKYVRQELTKYSEEIEDKEPSDLAKEYELLKEKVASLEKEKKHKEEMDRLTKELDDLKAKEKENNRVLASPQSEVLADVKQQEKRLDKIESKVSFKQQPKTNIVENNDNFQSGTVQGTQNNSNSFTGNTGSNSGNNSGNSTRSTTNVSPSRTRGSNSGGRRIASGSRSYSVGTLSTDGKSIKVESQDGTTEEVSFNNILEDSSALTFVNNGETVRFNNQGNNVDIKIKDIEDPKILKRLEVLKSKQDNLTYTQNELDEAFKEQKKIVEDKKVVIEKIISSEQERAELDLLRQKLSMLTKTIIAKQN
jgi:hypothetical protein